jgi:hypothetical protein
VASDRAAVERPPPLRRRQSPEMPDPPANPNSRRFNHEMWLGEEPWQRITAARRVNWPPQAQTLITEYDA